MRQNGVRLQCFDGNEKPSVLWSNNVCSVATARDTTNNNAICCYDDIKSESIHVDKEMCPRPKNNDHIVN